MGPSIALFGQDHRFLLCGLDIFEIDRERPDLYGLYDLYDLHYLYDPYDLYDLYDQYDLYELHYLFIAHVVACEPCNLHDLGHVAWAGSVLDIQILHSIP